MDKITDTTGYEAPRIEDHGDLTELTAATTKGSYTDGVYPQGTPIGNILQTSP
ncbi:MAG TPA: lasso RiPP family leader peptide-containing protein [Clostridia bacterium]|nr:lasso RiPP family leader peptide-containing protein [Clostridia bacterium]